ncbi:hypothetical protein KC990_09245, partial [Proteus mirabilis]|uniref:hypothetical protein n=1 Tax=Proteus mirabilis TaxID=584 RepID=UPI0033154B1E
MAITRRRSSQIAGTLALLSPAGASLRQQKHWQCCIMQRCNVVNLSKLSFFVNTRKKKRRIFLYPPFYSINFSFV